MFFQENKKIFFSYRQLSKSNIFKSFTLKSSPHNPHKIITLGKTLPYYLLVNFVYQKALISTINNSFLTTQ